MFYSGRCRLRAEFLVSFDDEIDSLIEVMLDTGYCDEEYRLFDLLQNFLDRAEHHSTQDASMMNTFSEA